MPERDPADFDAEDIEHEEHEVPGDPVPLTDEELLVVDEGDES